MKSVRINWVFIFARQQIIAGFIVDFYCHAANLVIEVDGSIHEKQKQNDGEHEKVLKEMGLRVIRFRNEEVIQNLPRVINKVRETLENTSRN